MTIVYDDIIVGSGSSGSVMAARLSEDSKRKVLLIEAGPDYPDQESTPDSILDARHLPADHDWGLKAEMREGRSVDYARGKVVGGSSSTNACLALRGTPADYDEWRALGNSEWEWDSVLPVFRQMESDELGEGPFHGVGGPVPIRRYRSDELGPMQAAFVSACQEQGFPISLDNNDPNATGVGSGPWNIRLDGNRLIRSSAAIVYLGPARGRSNLSIKSDTLVDRVILDGARATGVQIRSQEGNETINGRRISLCAGAFGTPAILMRSGIGPADEVSALGIKPMVSLGGVGRNLADHAYVGIFLETLADSITAESHMIQTLLRYTASGSRIENDMQVIPFQGLPQPAFNPSAMLMKAHSRGAVRLRSPDPSIQPNIDMNLAYDAEDRRRLADGLKVLLRIVRSSRIRPHVTGTIHLANDQTVSPERFEVQLQQEDWVNDYIDSTVRHYVHAVGTARMGPFNDAGAVVDQHGRVHGCSGLRVVDASIMPTLPRANTNLTCIMIGERIAAWMRSETD